MGILQRLEVPGNRDPQQDEIDACESHLFKQIELIQPTIVATLGNFALRRCSRGGARHLRASHGQGRRPCSARQRTLLCRSSLRRRSLHTRPLKMRKADAPRLPELLGRSAGARSRAAARAAGLRGGQSQARRPSSSASSNLTTVECRASSPEEQAVAAADRRARRPRRASPATSARARRRSSGVPARALGSANDLASLHGHYRFGAGRTYPGRPVPLRRRVQRGVGRPPVVL